MQPKTLLLFCFLAVTVTASSQFAKGTRTIGAAIGSGAFSGGTTDYTYPNASGYRADNTNVSISLSPSYGVFINTRAVAGLSLLLNTSYQKIDNKTLADTTFSSSKANNTDLGLGVFFRYYLSTSNSVAPYLHAYLNGGTGFGRNSGFSFASDASGAYKETYSGESSGRFFLNSGLNIGLTKMINTHVGLDAFAGYAFSYTKLRSKTTSLRDYTGSADLTRQFELTQKFSGNGVNVGIGLQVFLERK